MTMVNGTCSTGTNEKLLRSGPLPGARAALLLLLSINLFNYIDRQVLAAVVENIEGERLCLPYRTGWSGPSVPSRKTP